MKFGILLHLSKAMRLAFLLMPLFTGYFSFGQTFQDSYIKNQVEKTYAANITKSSNLSPGQARKYKKVLYQVFSKQALQFDSVFRMYKSKTGFDFSTADSIVIVYQTSMESRLSDYIIISGKDTISYGETYITRMGRSGKTIIYKPFVPGKTQIRISIITSRDSLLTLIKNNDFESAQKLAKDNQVFDGATSTIITAKKAGGQYHINQLTLPPFDFVPVYRKE